MSDEDDFSKAFDGFGEETPPVKVDPTATPPAEPPVEPPKTAEPPVELPKEEVKTPEEPKKDEEPANKEEEATPPAPDDKKKEDPAKPPETPEAPTPPEPAPVLTKDDVQEVVSNVLNNERASAKDLETATKQVMEAYYPDGLSNVLRDEKTGKELRSPQDVVDVTDGNMTIDQAAQWLINEQYRLDQDVNKIKNDARAIAETTFNFRRDAVNAVQKYEPLFTKYPHLQQKTYDKLMKLVKADEKKSVILSSPDVMEFYDDALEPYQLAFEHSTKESATKEVTPPPAPEPPKPKAEDRMDESGDGGQTPVNDPNDFSQQVSKELSKPL